MTSSDHSEPPFVPPTGDQQEKKTPLNIVAEWVMDGKQDIGEKEGQEILEIIAATGKFWLEWEQLKSLMSSRLKKVLYEYPEANLSFKDQISVLGDTHHELVDKFEQALCSFTEGPPFTLQRLCEIILGGRAIYPKLSSLALALDKNLLVQSTLTISTDPYPPPITKNSDEAEKIEEPKPKSDSVENGAENNILVTSTLTNSTDPYPPAITKNSKEIEKTEEPKLKSDSVENGAKNATITEKDEVIVKEEAAAGNSEGNCDMKVYEASENKNGSATIDINEVD